MVWRQTGPIQIQVVDAVREMQLAINTDDVSVVWIVFRMLLAEIASL
jgi:hypothetical protein